MVKSGGAWQHEPYQSRCQAQVQHNLLLPKTLMSSQFHSQDQVSVTAGAEGSWRFDQTRSTIGHNYDLKMVYHPRGVGPLYLIGHNSASHHFSTLIYPISCRHRTPDLTGRSRDERRHAACNVPSMNMITVNASLSKKVC